MRACARACVCAPGCLCTCARACMRVCVHVCESERARACARVFVPVRVHVAYACSMLTVCVRGAYSFSMLTEPQGESRDSREANRIITKCITMATAVIMSRRWHHDKVHHNNYQHRQQCPQACLQAARMPAHSCTGTIVQTFLHKHPCTGMPAQQQQQPR